MKTSTPTSAVPLTPDTCARCDQPAALLEPGELARNHGRFVVPMHVGCSCRVRYSLHDLGAGTFADGERVADEAVAQWNALQKQERSAR